MAVLKCNINNTIKNIDLRRIPVFDLENVTIERMNDLQSTIEYLHITYTKDKFKIELSISAPIIESIADIHKIDLVNLNKTPLKLLLNNYEVTQISLGRTLHQQYDTVDLFFDRTENGNDNGLLTKYTNSKNTSAIIKTIKHDESISYDINLTLEQLYKLESTHQFIAKIGRNKYVLMEIATDNLGKITDAAIVQELKPTKQEQTIELEDSLFGLTIKHNIVISKQLCKEGLDKLQSPKLKFKLNEISCKRQHLKYSKLKTKKESTKNINKYTDLAIKSALERLI